MSLNEVEVERGVLLMVLNRVSVALVPVLMKQIANGDNFSFKIYILSNLVKTKFSEIVEFVAEK